MITINTIETACSDLSLHAKVARILAQELPGLDLLSEPLDVVDSLEQLSDEMSYMPEVIEDCRLATETFDELDRVIGHMYALADRAVELPLDRLCERELLDEEFKGYSHIVARLAGANDFDGPSLSLASRQEAICTRKILGYLNEARNGFTHKLSAQRRQISDAMDEALRLLVKIVSDSEDLSYHNREKLSEILDRLVLVNDFLHAQSERPSPGKLH